MFRMIQHPIARLSSLFRPPTARRTNRSQPKQRARLSIEALEARIVPSAATHLVISELSNPMAGVQQMVTVTAVKGNGTTDTTYAGRVHFLSSDGKALVPADYRFSASDHGVHAFPVTFKSAGQEMLTVSDTLNRRVAGSLSDGETELAPGIVVAPGPTSQFVVQPTAATATAGAATTFTIKAEDSFGNLTPSYTGTVGFTSSDARALLPDDYTFRAVDQGTSVVSASFLTAGTQSLTVTDMATTIRGAPTKFAVAAGPASSLIVSDVPNVTMAGVAEHFVVTLRDDFGNIAIGFRGTVAFSATSSVGIGSTANLPANYTFRASDHGVHAFSTTFQTVGVWSLSANSIGATLTSVPSTTQVIPNVGALSVRRWTAGQPGYNGSISITGNFGGADHLTVTGLPVGLHAALRGNTLFLFGTPVTAGYFDITVSVSYSYFVITRSYSFLVSAPANVPLPGRRVTADLNVVSPNGDTALLTKWFLHKAGPAVVTTPF
jgi:hypothetical protein